VIFSHYFVIGSGGFDMAKNKGKPSGKEAEEKTSPGRKGDYKRSGWPEDAATQRVENARGQQAGKPRRKLEERNVSGLGQGRNRKAGSPQ
jgi:hypothetical protein